MVCKVEAFCHFLEVMVSKLSKKLLVTVTQSCIMVSKSARTGRHSERKAKVERGRVRKLQEQFDLRGD